MANRLNDEEYERLINNSMMQIFLQHDPEVAMHLLSQLKERDYEKYLVRRELYERYHECELPIK